MEDRLIRQIESKEFEYLDQAVKYVASCALFAGMDLFDLGEDRISSFVSSRYLALVECNIGESLYDTVILFRIRQETFKDTETAIYRARMRNFFILPSNSGSGRVEDVHYEVNKDHYLTRVVSDACSCCCYVDSVFDQQGNTFNHFHNVRLANDDLFGGNEDD